MDFGKMSLELHEKMRGKIEVISKVNLADRVDLSLAYTPGVAEPCKKIAENPDDAYKYTSKGNLVAVVSDGSAVLGIGNIGGQASMPVMEGKAVLFKKFGGIDAFPICLDTQDDEEIINTVKNIAPSFGGINLEDIKAPRCFYIEERLKKELDIPVFHDDQHGTAVCVLAGLMNACRLVKKDLTSCRIAMLGVGAAGIAICKILLNYGVKEILLVDRKGIISKGHPETWKNEVHKEMAKQTNPNEETGTLQDALRNADIFIGVSGPNVISKEMVASMNKNAILFALANPNPEILPDEAKAGGAAVIATGRSDFPNQINNVLVFPGIFKGAFAVRASEINEEMKLAAAKALASLVSDGELHNDYVIPSALNLAVANVVAQAVAEAARKSGIARI